MRLGVTFIPPAPPSLRLALATQGLLCFRVNFRIAFSSSARTAGRILMWIVLETAFGNIDIFKILILAIHEHGKPFCLIAFHHMLFSVLPSFTVEGFGLFIILCEGVFACMYV